MSAKEPRISVRVDGILKTRIETVCKNTGIDEAAIVRNCIEAICDYFEQTGSVTFPVVVSSKNRARAVSSSPHSTEYSVAAAPAGPALTGGLSVPLTPPASKPAPVPVKSTHPRLKTTRVNAPKQPFRNEKS